jgi:hypothetical protein
MSETKAVKELAEECQQAACDAILEYQNNPPWGGGDEIAERVFGNLGRGPQKWYRSRCGTEISDLGTIYHLWQKNKANFRALIGGADIFSQRALKAFGSSPPMYDLPYDAPVIIQLTRNVLLEAISALNTLVKATDDDTKLMEQGASIVLTFNALERAVGSTGREVKGASSPKITSKDAAIKRLWDEQRPNADSDHSAALLVAERLELIDLATANRTAKNTAYRRVQRALEKFRKV